MNNTEYLQSIGLNEGDKNYQQALDAMNVYGDNRWWLSDDPRVRGYYGLNEPILLTSMGQFHEDVETLVGRPVQSFEFATSYVPGLKREAQEAWEHGECESSVQERASGALSDFLQDYL